MESLLTTPWLPVLYRDGSYGKLAPIDLANEDVVDIAASRADFQGAAWQFLIGLLQTTMAPKDWYKWDDIWEEGLSAQTVQVALIPLENTFLFGTDSPSFMQDYTPLTGESISLAMLLPETPGSQTTKLNKDHFVKRGTVEAVCPHCAALALFSLQLNAPSGGKGYRTGLRGGGPMTTLVELHRYKEELQPPLWRKLWLNVMPQRNSDLPLPDKYDSMIFPWLGPTRTSEKDNGITTSEQVNKLQAYWGMPRRIRINFDDTRAGYCDLCGEQYEALLTSMTVKNYGTNYVGWVHPLTPHRKTIKTNETFSVKGQPGGLLWRDWLGLNIACQSENNNETPAQVIKLHLENRVDDIEAGIWGFGYDFDNMKARCWYEHHLPLIHVAENRHESVKQALEDAARSAARNLSLLRSALKEAWFEDAKSARGDFSFIDVDFWQQTQPFFFDLINVLKHDTTEDVALLLRKWNGRVWFFTRNYFDKHTISNPYEQTDFSNIMKVRRKYFVSGAKKATGKKANEETAQETIKMHILNQSHCTTLKQWHADLNEQKGHRLRASLRRSNSLEDIFLSEGFRSLLMRVPSLWKSDDGVIPWRFNALAIVAALTAHIRTINEQQNFAGQLSALEGQQPVMSELRFKRLQEAGTYEELLRQLRRAVQLRSNGVNLSDLADSVFCWCQQEDERIRQRLHTRQPDEYIRVRWAMGYYRAFSDNDKKSSGADEAISQE